MQPQAPFPYPSPVSIMTGPPAAGTAAAFNLFKGADWPMLIQLFDPSTQQLLEIPAGTSFVADLYFANSTDIALTLTSDNNGVQAIDYINSYVLLLAPRAVTSEAMLTQQPVQQTLPLAALPGYRAGIVQPAARLDTRVVLWAISVSGIKQPAAVFTINVGDLRSIDQAYFQENQAALGYGTITQVLNGNVLRTAQLKRAMSKIDPGSVQAMFESGVFGPGEEDPGYITWRDDYAPVGGLFDQLAAQWLQSPAPAGRGLTADVATQKIAAWRAAAPAL